MHEVFATVFTDGSMIASDDEDVFSKFILLLNVKVVDSFVHSIHDRFYESDLGCKLMDCFQQRHEKGKWTNCYSSTI